MIRATQTLDEAIHQFGAPQLVKYTPDELHFTILKDLSMAVGTARKQFSQGIFADLSDSTSWREMLGRLHSISEANSEEYQGIVRNIGLAIDLVKLAQSEFVRNNEAVLLKQFLPQTPSTFQIDKGSKLEDALIKTSATANYPIFQSNLKLPDKFQEILSNADNLLILVNKAIDAKLASLNQV